MNNFKLSDLKSRYSIAHAWRDLDLPGQPGKCGSSPFRPDQTPSFSVFDDGTRFKDHATGDSGDVLDFIIRARGCSMAEAIRFVQDRLVEPCRLGWKVESVWTEKQILQSGQFVGVIGVLIPNPILSRLLKSLLQTI